MVEIGVRGDVVEQSFHIIYGVAEIVVPVKLSRAQYVARSSDP